MRGTFLAISGLAVALAGCDSNEREAGNELVTTEVVNETESPATTSS